MGRIKYDINVKPNEFMSNHFLVRFTNKDAMEFFRTHSSELNQKVVSVRLNEWFAMTDEMNKLLKKMKFYGGDLCGEYTWGTKDWDWC